MIIILISQNKDKENIWWSSRFKLLRYFDNNTLNQTTNSLKLNNLNVFHHEEEEEEERYDNNFDKSKQRQRKRLVELMQ